MWHRIVSAESIGGGAGGENGVSVSENMAGCLNMKAKSACS